MMRSITTFSLLLRTRQIARLTAAISDYAQLRGLGWLVTVAQHLSDYATAEALRSRIEARDDLPLSEGYSAAPHALLTAPELERELRWAFSNPWRSGLRDRFGIERRWLAPPLPDFDRVAATALYDAEAEALVALSAAGGGADSFARILRLPPPVPAWAEPSGSRPGTRLSIRASSLSVHRAGSTAEFPLLTPLLGTADGQIAKRCLRALRRSERRLRAAGRGGSSRLVLLLDLDAAAGEAAIESAISILRAIDAALSDNPAYRLDPFGALLEADTATSGADGAAASGRPPQRSGPAASHRRGGRETDYRVAEARTGRSGVDRKAQAVLELLGRRQPAGEAGSAAAEEAMRAAAGSPSRTILFPPERELIASMMGTVTLPGSLASATFVEGRLSAVGREAGQLEFPAPAEALLTVDARPTGYRSESAFSFEGTAGREELRGILAQFRVEGAGIVEPGTISMSCSISDRAEPLLIDLVRRGPRFADTVRRAQLHPFVLTPFELDTPAGAVRAESLYPDGEPAELLLRPEGSPGRADNGPAPYEVRGTGTSAGGGAGYAVPPPAASPLRGAEFRFTLLDPAGESVSTLSIGFCEGGLSVVRTCVCWLERRKERTLFRVSVCADPVPENAALLSQSSEHFTLLVAAPATAGSSADRGLGFPELEFPRSLRGHIDRPWFRR